MKILITPNAMKGSLSARQFAEAIAHGLLVADPGFQTEILPIADGGDGTAEILIDYWKGIFIAVNVQDPLGRIIESRFGWIDSEKTAVIEMADASGLKLISPEERDPTKTSTYGLGQLIAAALNRGATKIILGLGGSATVDGGVGLLNALGGVFFSKGKILESPWGKNLSQIDDIDLSNLRPGLINCKFDIICDVTNPLLGQNGAAAVFAPQKGATSQQVDLLEDGLKNLCHIIDLKTGKDYSSLPALGAAGGAALPIVALLGGTLVAGANYILDILRFDHHLLSCDLVITGEGCIDAQTLKGKGPGEVARRAKKNNLPVIGLGGSVHQEASSVFDALFSILNAPMNLDQAMKNAEILVKAQATEVGRLIKIMQK